MGKYGTLQIRINLAKAGKDTVKLAGPVSAHDQPKPGADHTIKKTKRGLGHIIRGRKGEDDVLRQIKGAIKAAGYKLYISK